MIILPNRFQRDAGFTALIGVCFYSMVSMELDAESSYGILHFLGKLFVYSYVLYVSLKDFARVILVHHPGYVPASLMYVVLCVGIGIAVCLSAGTTENLPTIDFIAWAALGLLCIKHGFDCSYYD